MVHRARVRGVAFEGNGYGTRRRLLLESARDRIELSISKEFYCEAITLIESVVSDRLESRLSWLKRSNVGFKTLGWLIKELQRVEVDEGLVQLLQELDHWRELRNGAIHELVKVEAQAPAPDWGSKPTDWEVRMRDIGRTAVVGYELLKGIYHAVADLNPNKHPDRFFQFPRR